MCNHCCLRRIDHVRSVELASKAHFQHHDIAFCLVKIQHTDRRDQFKLARMVLHSVRFLSHPVCDLAQRLLGDIFSAHLNPLTEILDVGGRKETGAISRFPQDPFQHCTGRALPVRSGHMDEAKILLGIAQSVQQFPCSVKAKLPLAPVVMVDIVDRFLYCHLPDSSRSLVPSLPVQCVFMCKRRMAFANGLPIR